ncbi:MAG: glutamine-hydrolyzing carbamoyl-phosphate synthase small subunit [Myxococcales bacterium]|nr:glutamine-hydrolyzing carbamoyl-phosphate synthase small subunit [Myxococcales bacterium]
MADSARLVLEDGTVVRGRSFGARASKEGAGLGEVVFNTALTGYEEVVTDPSYRGQIVVMTAPEIGNTGWNSEDLESQKPWLSGFVVRELSPVVSNWRSQSSLGEVLAKAGIPGIEGVDTRMLTQKLRDQGAMRGLIISDDKLSDAAVVDYVKKSPGLEGRDLVREVTSTASFTWDEGSWHHAQDSSPRRARDKHIVAYDFGMKRNILRMLVDAGCRVTVVPATTPATDVLAMRPDGVFLSNGPGDPAAVTYAAEACRAIVDKKVPLFGICLGHQILGLALGGATYKLKFGHHGANCPVMDLSTRKVEITSQNHGFAVDVDSLRGKAELTHVNLNDSTVEGMRLGDRPAFSVQYHPEASPGPHDASYLFDRFMALIERQR